MQLRLHVKVRRQVYASWQVLRINCVFMIGKALDPDDENQLWSRFCKGDRAAFDKIYTTYFPLLFQYCIRFTPDRNFILDVLQDFFIELFSKPPRHTNIQHLKSYLLVAVRRKLLKAVNKDERLFEELADEDTYHFYLALSADNVLIEKQDYHNRNEAIQHIVNHLTSRQREAVYLYFYENLSYIQIAEIMSLKEVKYARTLIYRALDEMREFLSHNKALSALIRN